MKQLHFSFARCFALMIFALTLTLAVPAFASGPGEFLLYSFRGGANGCQPLPDMVSDSAGNLYGMAGCGAFNNGIVYELVRPTPPSETWTEQVLYTFTGGNDGGNNGDNIFGPLTWDSAGNLYGTTWAAGSSDMGVVFRLAPPATTGGAWTESVIHTFHGGSADGAVPWYAGVVFDAAGNLFGTTTAGGTGPCAVGCGVVYELTPPATEGAEWTVAVVHSFNHSTGDFPMSTPIFDAQGNLYGTTNVGGVHDGGAAYRLLKPASEGGVWQYKVLYAFGNNDSINPMGSLTLHGSHRLYGTLTFSQTTGFGGVFELVPPAVAGDPWTENILYSFTDGSDGAYPSGNVLFDQAGNLYGTAQRGGGNGVASCGTGGCGTVWELTPSGSAWSETTVHSFPTSSKDAKMPFGGLVRAHNGVLIGAAPQGGAHAQGAVFGIVP